MTAVSKLDISKARQTAEEELLQERQKNATLRIKDKLKDLARAEKVVANIKRELEELEFELSQDS